MAVGAALIAVVGARVGLPGVVLRMNYMDRRLKIVSTLLQEHRDRLSSREIIELEKEVSYIIDEILGTSDSIKIKQMSDWNRQSALRRFFLLPRPRSVMGWVLTLFSYMYLFGAGIYLFVLLTMRSFLADGDVYRIGLIGFVGSLLVFIFLRMLGLIVARRDLGWRAYDRELDSESAN